MKIAWKGAVNFTKGRAGKKPIAIVLHIMDGTMTGTAAWFMNPASDVSSHFGVGKNGEVHQYVLEEDTAWCNGVVVRPTWKLYDGKTNPNLTTLSIEHEGDHNDAWPDAQKKASAELIYELSKKWDIPLDRDHVIGHYQIRASKPNCPAENKKIIDELIAMAKKFDNPDAPSEPVKESIKMTDEMKKAVKALGLDLGDNFDPQDQSSLAQAILKMVDEFKKKAEKIEEVKKIIS